MTKTPQNPQVPKWPADWRLGVEVRVERDGQTVLSAGQADLLAAIERTRSISAAARALGISYRHAWQLVQAVNCAAAEPLVASAVGGMGGGGAQLTALGTFSLQMFEQLRGQVRESAAELVQQIFLPTTDLAATVHLAAAISLQEAVGQLLTEYALRHPQVRVRAVYGASNELADHLLAGAPCDAFISADPVHIDRLTVANRIEPESRMVVGTNSLAAIGAAAPARSEEIAAIGTAADLLSPEVKHVALADPASPLGKCSQAYLAGLGIYDAVLAKAVHVDNAQAVPAAVRSGCADAGLALASDAARAKDCRILFSVDPSIAQLSYTAAVVRNGQRESDARELLAFFGTPLAQRCLLRCGLILPPRR
jgi:molybdenum ABC transporter molybdate-binding protein